jgi:hypothetical protein
MAKTKLNIIRPVLGVLGVSDGDLLQRLNAVHDGILNNPAYPKPPVDMTVFKAAIDAYAAAVSGALDGGKSAFALRDKCRADVIVMFRLLGHYVEANCKNDTTTFLSSGFVPSSTGQRTPPQPTAIPLLVSINPGDTGQLVVTFKPVAKARIYEIRYVPVTTPGTGSYLTQVVAFAKPATTIGKLTPGVNYTFQVRAFGRLGFSGWSATLNRICA